MSEQNVERVRAAMPPDGSDLVQFFGTPGQYSSGGLVADDATVRFIGPGVETRTSGVEGFFESWADWLEPWETYRIHYEELIDRGDRVVALVRMRGVTKRDRVEMEQEAAGVFRFEGSQVVALEFHLDRDAALAD